MLHPRGFLWFLRGANSPYQYILVSLLLGSHQTFPSVERFRRSIPMLLSSPTMHEPSIWFSMLIAPLSSIERVEVLPLVRVSAVTPFSWVPRVIWLPQCASLRVRSNVDTSNIRLLRRRYQHAFRVFRFFFSQVAHVSKLIPYWIRLDAEHFERCIRIYSDFSFQLSIGLRNSIQCRNVVGCPLPEIHSA